MFTITNIKRTKNRRCQEPKKEYKRIPRIKERISKKLNLKGSSKTGALRFLIWNFFGSWHLGFLALSSSGSWFLPLGIQNIILFFQC